jgi:hypothetical protein
MLEDLSRFRWHTGAALRRLDPDEPCPVLFRDVGPKALVAFLEGKLARFAGPQTPLTYMRTVDYQEPYTDHAATGRLVFLAPHRLDPWESGVPNVFVAAATCSAPPATVAYVPGTIDLSLVARAAVRTAAELRDAFGGRDHDARVEHSHRMLVELNGDLDRTERNAEPLRALLQSRERKDREKAREAMLALGLTEEDLCRAWHHLPESRRDFIRAAVSELRGRLVPCS